MKAMCGKFRPEKRSFTDKDKSSDKDKSKKQKVENIECKPDINQVRLNNGNFSDSSDEWVSFQKSTKDGGKGNYNEWKILVLTYYNENEVKQKIYL